MATWLRILIPVLVCLMGAPAAQGQEDVTCEGPLQEDAWRHPNTGVFARTAVDLAAVPASAVAWDERDWARFGALALPTVALMWPAQPSLDTKTERWLKDHRSRTGDRIFFKIKTMPISYALAGYGALVFGSAWLTKNDRLFEFGTLSIEALAVTQFWHVTLKLLSGRESPYQDERGRLYGPTQLHFPGGTPSGHAASTYAVLAVLAEYWDTAPLYALAHLGGIYASMSLVYHRQHFVSDVIWGAGMGYFIGRWVVRHRSSRYRCGKRVASSFRERLMVMPVVSGTRAFGLTFSLQLF